MDYYRITKYNPEFRDEKGYYTVNDWTAISDIGKPFVDGILTISKYKQVEDAYVKTIKTILKEKDISQMTICGLEKNSDMEEFIFSPEEKNVFDKVCNNFCAELHEIEIIVRLVLREVIWCNLLSDIGNIEIEFGYDYYMYIRCNEIEETTKKKIIDNGLFVELL